MANGDLISAKEARDLTDKIARAIREREDSARKRKEEKTINEFLEALPSAFLRITECVSEAMKKGVFSCCSISYPQSWMSICPIVEKIEKPLEEKGYKISWKLQRSEVSDREDYMVLYISW